MLFLQAISIIMKISYNWLKNYIDLDIDAHKAAEILTDIGLEVESVELEESVKGGLQGLVIGEVVHCEKHPDADKLSITRVKINAAGDISQIVCGASNVAAGQKVVVALPGATLFPATGEPFKIKTSKIRGVESQGMICAEDEIGLGESHDGIMVLDPNAETGTPANTYFDLESDFIIHIGLTPNRADATSHFGVARDLAAALSHRYGKSIQAELPEIKNYAADTSPEIKITIEEPELCARYAGILVKNVTVGDSPKWLQDKLKMIGLRPINNVVDITNYVLHECGQPLHAFDADKIAGKQVVVKTMKAKTKFKTLDETDRELTGDELMICDAEKPMCIAGVFGGAYSGVTQATRNVFVESAWFNPVSVRKTARKHGFHTDASFRFERGVDPSITVWALTRAANLMEEICGGKAGGYSDINPIIKENQRVDFSLHNFHAFAGKKIPSLVIQHIFQSLEIKILQDKEGIYQLEVPAYRVDVLRESDVYEEILRIYSFNEIEIPQKLNASLSFSTGTDKEKITENIADFLASKGLNEIINNSLTNSNFNKTFGGESAEKSMVNMLNPLSSELDILRQEMVFGGLQAIAYNSNRQMPDVKFFEFGKTYHKYNGKFEENEFLSVWLSGRKEPENWNSKNEALSFYSIIAVTEGILKRLFGEGRFTRKVKNEGFYENGFEYFINNKNVGSCGTLSSNLVQAFDIKNPVHYAQLKWNEIILLLSTVNIRYKEISKFPAVRRDLSMILNESVSFAEIRDLVKSTDKKLIRDVGIFDFYHGKNIEAGKKSYAISILLQHDERTLTDHEIDELMNKVIKILGEKTGAALRA